LASFQLGKLGNPGGIRPLGPQYGGAYDALVSWSPGQEIIGLFHVFPTNGQETTARITSTYSNMEAPDPEKMHRNSNPDPPPQYRQDYAVDEYPSEDELEDHDLDILNTDYSAQRELSFYPIHQQHQLNTHYNPSVPPSLRESRDHANDTYNYPEKSRRNLNEWDEGALMPRLKNSMIDGGNDYRLPQHNARAYQAYHKRKPLIDLIRNEWQNSPYTSSSSSPTSTGYHTPSWIQVLSAPRYRRYLLVLLGILSLLWGSWHYWAGPQWGEHRLLSESLNERVRTGDGWFGENLRPEFLDMVHVKTLDQDLVPQRGDEKRLIIVGDVHGCHDEREYTNLFSRVS